LITGSSGLIGSKVAIFFSRHDYQFNGIDDNHRAIFFGRRRYQLGAGRIAARGAGRSWEGYARGVNNQRRFQFVHQSPRSPAAQLDPAQGAPNAVRLR
jgi:hypothetical protein